MKTTIYFFAIVLVSCSKTENNTTPLNSSDAEAVVSMVQQKDALLIASTNLATASTLPNRHHWDSIFHRHDSLFWVHHNNYNINNNHSHNDHHHQWVPYDPTINHSHHYHRPYPHHRNDSLVTVSNGHHPNHNIHHTDIHSLHHHHVMDSLHHIHQLHHH